MQRRFLKWAAAMPVAAVVLLASGCGSEPTNTGVASAGGGTTATSGAAPAAAASLSPHERGLKFAQCMRENGVPMDDPEPGGGIRLNVQGIERSTVEAAQQKCQEFAPQGGQGGGPGGNPQMAENLAKMAKCMRDNGVEAFPDPEGGMMRITPEIGEDPDFPAAQKKCEANLPQRAPGS
ncbi:hypothetical protein [Sinosporangium siamense]|uniref:Secreted protein n=1 Tax=Sinosporangium siamense TaxID=1367973 RepID=A0A919RKL2_9ACTN|nr:hypothetical protein [Sinosporangium siamense]GII94962.1 hypothetical protein Ssi02_51930 [Sinosporangium siamense]